MQEKPFSSEKIFNLDSQAKELGMGGKLSPESDESSYKKRMQQRKDIQAERLQIRKTKKGLLIVFTELVNFFVGPGTLDNLPTAGWAELSIRIDEWSQAPDAKGEGALVYHLFPKSLAQSDGGH